MLPHGLQVEPLFIASAHVRASGSARFHLRYYWYFDRGRTSLPRYHAAYQDECRRAGGNDRFRHRSPAVSLRRKMGRSRRSPHAARGTGRHPQDVQPWHRFTDEPSRICSATTLDEMIGKTLPVVPPARGGRQIDCAADGSRHLRAKRALGRDLAITYAAEAVVARGRKFDQAHKPRAQRHIEAEVGSRSRPRRRSCVACLPRSGRWPAERRSHRRRRRRFLDGEAVAPKRSLTSTPPRLASSAWSRRRGAPLPAWRKFRSRQRRLSTMHIAPTAHAHTGRPASRDFDVTGATYGHFSHGDISTTRYRRGFYMHCGSGRRVRRIILFDAQQRSISPIGAFVVEMIIDHGAGVIINCVVYSAVGRYDVILRPREFDRRSRFSYSSGMNKLHIFEFEI